MLSDEKRTKIFTGTPFEGGLHAVQDVPAILHIAHLIGNTWVRFGKTEVMLHISVGVTKNFDRLACHHHFPSKVCEDERPEGYKWPVT